MTEIKCDECGLKVNMEHIVLKGYYPAKASGILIPDHCRLFDFCSHKCFVEWIKKALTKEN